MEAISRETWFWSSTNFITSQRSLEYDYHDNVVMMLLGEIIMRILRFFRLLLCYGFISAVNALTIRVAIRASVVMVFGFMHIENVCFTSGAN